MMWFNKDTIFSAEPQDEGIYVRRGNYNLSGCGVYRWKDYSPARIANDYRLQISMIVKAGNFLFSNDYLRKYDRFPIYEAFLGAGDTGYGKAFNILKEKYDNGDTIDRTAFDRVMESIIRDYPELYDNMMAKWTLKQTRDNMLKYADFFEEKLNYIKGVLKIPDELLDDYFARNYLVEALSGGYCTLSEACDITVDRLRQDEEEAEARRERNRIYMEEQFWDDVSAAKSEAREKRREKIERVAETAVGTYIGTKMANKRKK